MTDKIYDVAVIGGGASGIMAAISAARKGAAVLVIDHANRLGKKILVTGNGRCNFTNSNQNIKNYHTSSPEIVEEALSRFGHDELITFFGSLGLFVKEKEGYYYPFSESAADALDVLLLETKRLTVDTMLSAEVRSIKRQEDFFFLSTEPPSGKSQPKLTGGSQVSGKLNTGDGDAIRARRLVISTGGRAGKNLGCDGTGYRLAASLGHSVTALHPALVPLEAEGDFNAVAGVRTDAAITLYVDGQIADSDAGQLQITDYGISGIPVFQISSAAARALNKKRDVRVCIDFLPQISLAGLSEEISGRIQRNPEMRVCDAFLGMLNRKLINFLLGSLRTSKKTRCFELSAEFAGELAGRMKRYEVRIKNTLSFERAQTTSGGIPLDEVESISFESKRCPGLYLCGELLDVDGRCGGYNLQWAFTSGYLAGCAAGEG